jgi:hypothetical protein
LILQPVSRHIGVGYGRVSIELPTQGRTFVDPSAQGPTINGRLQTVRILSATF